MGACQRLELILWEHNDEPTVDGKGSRLMGKAIATWPCLDSDGGQSVRVGVGGMEQWRTNGK